MMPEIPNVDPGTAVEATWGNQVRDRSIQRYADLAALQASVPNPAIGETAWLQDIKQFVVYYDPDWEQAGPSLYGHGFAADPQLGIANGGAAEPTYGFRGYSGLGMYLASANVIGITTAGARAMQIGDVYHYWDSKMVNIRYQGIDDFVETALVPNLHCSTGSDKGRLYRSTATLATLGVEGDDLSPLQARLQGTDPKQLLGIIEHLVDRIEALEA